MSLDPLYNEVAATTREDIRDQVVWNNFYVDTPLQDHFRRSGAFDDFTGGRASLSPYLYGGPNGGGVDPGQTVTVTRQQLLTDLSFQPRAYATWFSVDDYEMSNGEHAGVINAGPNAAVDLYTVYLEGLTSQLNTFLEFDWYRHGQASSATVSDNRIKLIDGASEALNDGVTPSWDGNRFTTYGSNTRNGAVLNAINSIPRFAGNPDGSAGQISYEFLIQTYLEAINEPDIGITSKAGYGYIASFFQRQQRFDIKAVRADGVNWSGLTFERAIIYADWLTPSAVSSSFLPTKLVGGGGTNNATSTINTLAMSPATASGVPTVASVTVGETFWWLYGPSWRFRPTNNPAWYFGIRRTSAYDNVSLDALFMRLACNWECPSPRDNVQCYGFSS